MLYCFSLKFSKQLKDKMNWQGGQKACFWKLDCFISQTATAYCISSYLTFHISHSDKGLYRQFSIFHSPMGDKSSPWYISLVVLRPSRSVLLSSAISPSAGSDSLFMNTSSLQSNPQRQCCSPAGGRISARTLYNVWRKQQHKIQHHSPNKQMEFKTNGHLNGPTVTLSSWNWWWKSLKRETSWLSGEKSVEKTHWRQEGRLSFHLTSHKQNTLCLLHKSCNKRGGDRRQFRNDGALQWCRAPDVFCVVTWDFLMLRDLSSRDACCFSDSFISASLKLMSDTFCTHTWIYFLWCQIKCFKSVRCQMINNSNTRGHNLWDLINENVRWKCQLTCYQLKEVSVWFWRGRRR